MTHHDKIIDLNQPKPKMAKNYRHGMRCQNPALLPKEDREQFEQLFEGLCQKYQVENDPVASHLAVTLGMCILKQYRIWQAESAMAVQLSPPPPKPSRPSDPHPDPRGIDSHQEWLSDLSPDDPEVIRREKRVIDQLMQSIDDNFPSGQKLPEASDWQDWIEALKRNVKWGFRNLHPATAQHSHFLDKRHEESPWLRNTFTVVGRLSQCTEAICPTSQVELEDYKFTLMLAYADLKTRADEITKIQSDRANLETEYQAQLAQWDAAMQERQLLETSPIGEQAELIIKYSIHNDYQMNGAIAKLERHLWSKQAAQTAP